MSTGIDSGIDLTVKTHKEKFPCYHCFRAQRICYITITSTYTYKIDANNQLHNCVCGALSIKITVLL